MEGLSNSGGSGPPGGNIGPPSESIGPPGGGQVDDPNLLPRSFVPGKLLVILQRKDREPFDIDDETRGSIEQTLIDTYDDDFEISELRQITFATVNIVVIQTTLEDDERLISGIGRLVANLQSGELANTYDFQVTADTLMGGAPGEMPPPDQGGGGGPGSKPIKPMFDPPDRPGSDLLAQDDYPWNYILDDRFHGPTFGRFQASHQNRSNEPAQSVEVFVLDTVPPLSTVNRDISVAHLRSMFDPPRPSDAWLEAMCNSLEDAHSRWTGDNPLVERLCGGGPGGGGVLDPDYTSQYLDIYCNPIFDAGGVADNPLRNSDVQHIRHYRKVGTDEYPYIATDHGTFVAGIIHTLAPHAKINIVETLNAYAVGSVETFLTALGTIRGILKEKKPRYVVVNASLVFEHSVNFCALQTCVQGFVKAVEGEGIHLVMFAAAGNDGFGTSPAPRYPAALNEFNAVSAVDRDSLALSWYSNSASFSCDAGGFAAFGGNINYRVRTTGHRIADARNGVLGMYIGTLPNIHDHPGNPPAAAHTPGVPPHSQGFTNVLDNDNGWSKWAGTSFATPVLTGCAAQLITDGVTGNVLYILENAFSRITPTGEHCLLLWQP